MSLTTDPKDPKLGHGVDEQPTPQNETYLILSEEERAKGFIRPVRKTYIHVGTPGPTNELRDLTDEEKERYADVGYVKYEEYPKDDDSSVIGRFWTQEQLDKVGQGCKASTTMGTDLAETYAAKPHFYGSTYCCNCQKHRPVGKDGEFVWEDGERVGT